MKTSEQLKMEEMFNNEISPLIDSKLAFNKLTEKFQEFLEWDKKRFNDFYFSKKSFELFKYDNPIICEVFIDGEWKVFTEKITSKIKPLSRWDDLIYLGTAKDTKTRYTKTGEWLMLNDI